MDHVLVRMTIARSIATHEVQALLLASDTWTVKRTYPFFGKIQLITVLDYDTAWELYEGPAQILYGDDKIDRFEMRGYSREGKKFWLRLSRHRWRWDGADFIAVCASLAINLLPFVRRKETRMNFTLLLETIIICLTALLLVAEVCNVVKKP